MKSFLILFISLHFALATNTSSADSEISWFIPRHLFCPKEEIERCGICHKAMSKDQVTVSYHATEIHRIHSKCFINFAHICEMKRCPYCRDTNVFPSKFDAYELACFLDMDAVIEYYTIAKNFPLTAKEQILETNALLCSYVKIFSWPRFAFHWRAIRWMEAGENYKHLSEIFEEYENLQKSSKMKSQLAKGENLTQKNLNTNQATVYDDNSSDTTYLVKIGKDLDEENKELAWMSYLLLRQSKFCFFIMKNVKQLWRLLEIKEGEFHNLLDSYSNLKVRLTVLKTLNQCDKHQLKPEEWNLLHIQVCHLELVVNGYTNMLKYMKKFELPITILHSHEILGKLYQTGYTAEFFKILRIEQVEIRSYNVFKFIYGAGDCKVCIEKYASSLSILKNRPEFAKDLVNSISEPYKFNKLYYVAMHVVEKRGVLWKECLAKALECHSFTDKQIAAIFLEKRKEEEFLEVVKAEKYFEVEYFLLGNLNPIALAAGISLHLKDNTPEAKNSMRKCIDRLRKDDADLLAVPIYFMKQVNNLAYKGLVQLLTNNHFIRLMIEVEIDSDLDESGIACLNYELIKNPQKMKIYADQFQNKYMEMLKKADARENDDDSWIATMIANFPKGADRIWLAEVPNERNIKAYKEIDAFKSPYFRKDNAITLKILDMVKKKSVKNLDDANFEDNIGWALALECVECNSEMHEYVLDQLLFSKHLIMAFRVCWDNPTMLSEIIVKKLPERFQKLHAALKLLKENEAMKTS